MTVVPANRTGVSTALGVSTPVRPTWTTMSSTLEGFFSGGYLNATAHLGNFAVEPRTVRSDRLFTFTTAPSISKGYSIRSSLMRSTSSCTAWVPVRVLWGITRNLWEAR